MTFHLSPELLRFARRRSHNLFFLKKNYIKRNTYSSVKRFFLLSSLRLKKQAQKSTEPGSELCTKPGGAQFCAVGKLPKRANKESREITKEDSKMLVGSRSRCRVSSEENMFRSKTTPTLHTRNRKELIRCELARNLPNKIHKFDRRVCLRTRGSLLFSN